MLINNIDLSSLGITLYDRVLSTNAIDTSQEWLDGDIQPTFIRQQERFKSMRLSFLVLTTNDEQEAFIKISKLTAMLKKASVKFDDLDLIFDITMVGGANEERLKNGNFIVSYDFTSDYAKGEREVYTTDANATNSFKLTVLYYQNGTTLLAQEAITIRAASFTGVGDTLNSVGVNVNKYQPQHYNDGIATNLGGSQLTYENLLSLQTLIINYTPVKYNLQINYYVDNGTGVYNDLLSAMTYFTYPQLQNATSIGQIVDAKTYRPEGFGAKIEYTGELTVEDLLKASPISVFYNKVEKPLEKNIAINYQFEDDNGEYSDLTTAIVYFKETDFIEGMTLKEIINVDAYRPSALYYNTGVVENASLEDLVSFDTVNTTYTIKYSKTVHTIYVEYYLGVYPNWYRSTALPIQTKYYSSYENEFNLQTLGIDFNKYQTATYKEGQLYNEGVFDTYEAVLNAGVIQIYYEPINFPIVVRYYKEIATSEPIAEETLLINDLMFISNPILNDIIGITAHRPEGYQFDAAASYSGEVSLAALTQASPINIVYQEIVELKTKNVIVKYKQELASAYSVINTSLLTINEADVADGIRLKDIINLDAYRPDYYEPGVVDGASSTALITFDQLGSSYEVAYLASTYTTPVRYFTDEVDELNWIGSSSITYRVIDFTVDTTLYDLGLNINAFKPSYGDNGTLEYTGPVNFTALRELEAINVVYMSIEEPEDPSGIDYPHRFLFLQHNDLGDYEHLQPSWTMNHAYINTGVVVDDMSKLTVIMECAPVDKNVPLHEVNAGYGYLFGSSSQFGDFYMRFNNQTQYGTNLTGTNTYEARAGKNTNKLTLTEESAVGFGENTGIYASDRAGYSYATFTYTNNLQSEAAAMPYPLYLFANNNNGSYANGLAGIGIYSCRIYYNNVLIRDMIPVQFYDKIGDLVAPSNCLYDKVSQAFFEDGTKKNSFNIIDDDRYTDTNLEHMIGHCYVNYYKGDEMFQTATIWFRGNDFEEEWDLYDKLLVEQYQPAYYHPGQITNLSDIPVVNFDNLNNKVFTVVYEEQDNFIEVNYYTNEATEANLIQTERISLKEKDFYQAPTFGDIVRLNKYRPAGYETNFQYTGKKVSLGRVVENSPYNIVYTPATDLTEYTTKIKYIKKIYGIRAYETIAEETLTLTQPMFRDGEYIDYYIDLNLHKPEKYYLDGERYGWYSMDERISTPDMLLDEYSIAYQPEEVSIDINYYVNEVAEENKVATTPWIIKLDQFDPRFEFTIVDELPNEYTNKFKPVNCNGGVFEDPSKLFTFETLADQGYINIIYERIFEPNDPESLEYEQKVLYWGNISNWLFLHGVNSGRDDTMECPWCKLTPEQQEALGFDFLPMDEEYVGGRIPYIDLGYNVKDLSRLRVEMKCAVCSEGFLSATTNYGFQTNDYTYFFGYYAPRTPETLGTPGASSPISRPFYEEYWSGSQYFSPNSAGGFALRCRLPRAAGWVYTTDGPSYIDGQEWYDAASSADSSSPGFKTTPTLRYLGMYGTFRKGYYLGTDENWNEYVMNNNYTVSSVFERWPGNTSCYWGGQTPVIRPYQDLTTGLNPGFENDTSNIKPNPIPKAWVVESNGPAAIPFYITLDAYNNYGSIYTDFNSNTPDIFQFDVSADDDYFEGRPEVKGSISLFQTTNPATGKVNIMPFRYLTRPHLGSTGALALNQPSQNPYGGSYQTTVEYEQLVITGQDENGNPIYEMKKYTRGVNFANFDLLVYPQMSGAAIWSIKIYDRDRLVRDLIPVAKNDKIYDYVMPTNGLFDLVTEIFFANSNMGGAYDGFGAIVSSEDGGLNQSAIKRTIPANWIYPLFVMKDPTSLGKITINYYDYDNNFIANQWVDIPSWLHIHNESLEDRLRFNDYKPDDFHLDGMLDLDADISFENMSLMEIKELGSANIYYKLKTFTKTVEYYQDNVRVGSKDLFISLLDIENAETLEDLGIEKDLYYTEDFAHGRIIFDENIIKSHNLKDFIDAPSPIVVYDKLTKEEAPNKFYVSYYRGGAYDDERIQYNPEDPNYLTCDLDAVVLNPNGAIKYLNHYHSALYEDETFDYFIPYQVKVINKFSGIHKGPGRKYQTLAMIIEKDTYTIVEERNGWGRLKEYQRGWIDLNATEPMYGPGQNPEYDTPDAQTATLPFATRFHISKLTIDRLWAYSPEIESWIKTEEISFDQAGKLYNGLDIKVIDLSAIDFTTVASLADMGIYPQAKKLQYHEFADEIYNGEFTLEAFQNLHELEFVYPETIYNLNCIYYKDKIQDTEESVIRGSAIVAEPLSGETITAVAILTEPVLGAIRAGSAPIGVMVELTGEIFTNEENDWYPVSYGDINGYMRAMRLTSIVEPTIVDIPSTELGRAGFSYSLSDWNPDWDTFIETSYQLDEYGNVIPPTLYRSSTPLFLTFDFYGCNKNLFKPEGSPDGIYIWNPQSWDFDNVRFTFEQIIKLGTQKVLYPAINPLAFKSYWLPAYYYSYTTPHPYISNQWVTHVIEKVSGEMSFAFSATDINYDREICYEPVYNKSFFDNLDPNTAANPNYYKYYQSSFNRAYTSKTSSNKYFNGTKYYEVKLNTEEREDATGNSTGAQKGDYYSFNTSGIRSDYAEVIGIRNYLNGTNTTEFYSNKIRVPQNLTLTTKTNSSEKAKIPEKLVGGTWHYIRNYSDYSLTDYWVPVPSGMWYNYNGQYLQFPDNGFFNIITGAFTPGPDVMEIYLKNKVPVEDKAYNYFEGKTFNYTDVNYIVQTTATINSYMFPDIYALPSENAKGPQILSGVIVPVSRVTSDTDNSIIGEWYYSSNQWFQTANTKLYADEAFNTSNLKTARDSVVIMKDIKCFLNPATLEASSIIYETTSDNSSTINQPLIRPIYYEYTDTDSGITSYFDGKLWIDASYTSGVTTESNRNYTLIRNTNCYSVPQASNNHIEFVYYPGDRITILYTADADPNWGYTGRGWVQIEGNLSEIV